MTPQLALQSADFARDLHTLLRDLDPVRWRAELEAALRDRLVRTLDAASQLQAGPDEQGTAGLRAAIASTHRVLHEALPSPNLGPSERKRAWDELRQALMHAYNDLSRNLEAWDIHVPSLRPTNYARNVLHVSTAVIAIGLLELVPTHTMLVTIGVFFFVLAWTLELTRRRSPGWNAMLMRVLGPVAHPHEWHRVNSATWYCTSLLALSLLDTPPASLAGLVALGIGDPLAAIVGRKYGKHRFANGRSVEGTAAFVLSTLALGTLLLGVVHSELAPLTGFLLAAAAAVTGAVVELTARRVDDNVAIPISASLAAAATLHLLT